MGNSKGSPIAAGSSKVLNISLHYFNVYGKVEPHKIFLNHAGASFNDSRI